MDNNANKNDMADKFSKNSFLNSQKYRNRRDLLSVLLKDNESYTEKQVSEKINEFMKGSAR